MPSEQSPKRHGALSHCLLIITSFAILSQIISGWWVASYKTPQERSFVNISVLEMYFSPVTTLVFASNRGITTTPLTLKGYLNLALNSAIVDELSMVIHSLRGPGRSILIDLSLKVLSF